jgi:hypothetical protein
MVVLTITADYDGQIQWDGSTTYTKNDTQSTISIGCGEKVTAYFRGYLRFPLTDLPADAQISQVRLYVYCNTAGGSAHLLDVHAYGSNGQENPQDDTGQTLYNRCASGNLYVDDSVALRTTGDKWFVLGGSVITDLINAKNAVNRFSLGLHEEGDNDVVAIIDALEKSGGYPAKLEITYTVPVVVARRIIGDGLCMVVF